MNKAFSLLVIVAMFLAVTVYARHPNTRWHELKAKKYDFKQYAQEFNKPYKNSVDSREYKLRKVIFENNLRTILAHNEGPSSYKMGVNHLTDLSKDEIRSQNGMHKSSLVSTAEPTLSHQLTDLPVSVDWRDRGAVTAVKDQGRCGSCWAFASTETLESHAFLETSFLMDLSPQQIASCAENAEKCGGTGGCNGATADVALAYVQKHGITTEWIDPYTSYTGGEFKCRQGSAYNTSAVRIHDWKHIKSNSLPETLIALNKVGPLIATVAADTWPLYEEGIFDGCETSKSVTLDHAVQLVGYGEDAKTGEKYFTIRNSWSPLWGEHGYIRLKRREEEICGFDSNPADGEGCPGGPSNITVCGTCGILYDSVYPLQTKLHLA